MREKISALAIDVLKTLRKAQWKSVKDICDELPSEWRARGKTLGKNALVPFVRGVLKKVTQLPFLKRVKAALAFVEAYSEKHLTYSAPLKTVEETLTCLTKRDFVFSRNRENVTHVGGNSTVVQWRLTQKGLEYLRALTTSLHPQPEEKKPESGEGLIS